ncbi:hypothetical protein [Nocardioides solisilvae]|uniref:hypothetical protein n=1 Tax=Nocardioides solisilvae TaxID=1542435 RepID=UPI000D7466FD|nr:hypothetical protein [Nocardioides solisilvae]
MYLRDVFVICLRRWPLLLLALVLSAGAVYAAAQRVPPSYRSEAAVVLVPPRNAEFPEQNRFLELGGLKQTADILVRSMSSSSTAEEIEAEVPDAEYTVLPDFATSAPVITLEATHEDPELAEATLRLLLERLPADLVELQESVNIRPSQQITQVVIHADDEAEPVLRAKVQVLSLLAAALLLVSVLAVALVDSLLRSRSTRRRSRKGRPGKPDATDEPDEPDERDERDESDERDPGNA